MKIIRINEVPVEERGGYSIKRLCTEELLKNPENIGFYETTIPQGSTCPSHAHENLDEFIIFLTKGTMEINEEIYNFENGDIVLLRAGDKHEFRAIDNEIKLIAIKAPNIPNDKVKY
jgi:quercetin dioxygenase-like cupin family protein